MTNKQKADLHKKARNAIRIAKIRKALEGNGAVIRYGGQIRKPDNQNYRELFKSERKK